MPIQIQSTPTLIEMNTQNASIAMSGNGKNVLAYDADNAFLEMKTELPKIAIDQSACFEECGLKGIRAFMDDSIAFGRQKFQEGVARIVDDGNQMAAIETHYDPIPDQAYRNAFASFEHEFNYGAIPTSRPKIDVIEGNVDVNYHAAKVNNETEYTPVSMHYNAGEVDIRVIQYGKVDISYDASSLYYHI